VNHRDLALAAMRGQPVDHIPFIARMELWFGYQRKHGLLPARYRNASLWQMQRDMGIGIQGHGALGPPFYKLVPAGFEVIEDASDALVTLHYQTPYGTLHARERWTEELQEVAAHGMRVEFPFKSACDYDALRFIIENSRVVANLEAYAEHVASLGTDGLVLPFSGYLPAHQLMLEYMGYERFFYEMQDHPAQVEALIAAIAAQQDQILDLATRCAAQAIEVGGNFVEDITPPRFFDTFFAPFYRRARQLLNAHGKILVTHGDGEMRGLLGKLMDCGIEVVEAITPKPMTSIDVAQTRQLWGDRVTFWGGLATVMLTESYSDDEFDEYMEGLFRAVAPGDHFILGFGDNVPTDAPFRRIQRVVEFWSQRGAYPLRAR
jgi:hypothetical protein